MGTIWKYTKKAFVPFLLIATLAQVAWAAGWGIHFEYNMSALSKLRLEVAVQCVGLLTIVVWAGETLERKFSFTRWWIGRLVGKEKPPGNIIYTLLGAKYAWPVFFALLLLAVPTLATYEEVLFRDGTKTGAGALFRSALFGLAHLVMGVSLNIVMVLTGVGLWFSYLYMHGDGGLAASTRTHIMYNLLAVGLFFAQTVRERVKAWQECRTNGKQLSLPV